MQFRLRDDHPLRSGNAKYTALRAPKMFTRIAARKHIKLHDTSEHTANVAQQQRRRRRRRRYGNSAAVLFISFCLPYNPIASTLPNPISSLILICATEQNGIQQCRYNYTRRRFLLYTRTASPWHARARVYICVCIFDKRTLIPASK